MEITLVMVGLLIISVYSFNEFLKRLCDVLNTEQDSKEPSHIVLSVERKGKGWADSERNTRDWVEIDA